MKKIINREGTLLTADEALMLCASLNRQTGAIYVDHMSVYGYPTASMAERATLDAACEMYTGYTFAFAGTSNKPFEGYKVRVIAIKDLPSNFQELFPNYVVIG